MYILDFMNNKQQLKETMTQVNYKRKKPLSNVEVRSIVARVEDKTTAMWSLLMEDETFKKMFSDFVINSNFDIKQVSNLLSDYANENLI